MDGKAWQTSTEAQAGKGPQREREKEEGVVVWGEINGGMVRGGILQTNQKAGSSITKK